MKERTLAIRLMGLVLSVLLVFPNGMIAAVSAPELPDPGSVGGITKDQQIQLGQKAKADVYQQMPVLPDSHPVVRYVQQLGKKLETVIPPQHSWPYEFHVIQQKEINAFAIPGGPIFINVGTITAADNEAELAGVMAHEMSHVYMQHSVKAMKKQGMAQGIAGIVGGILGSVLGGTAGTLANMGAQTAGGILSMKYSREDEAQADSVGAIIMYKAGYDPRAMAAFFEKLEKMGGGSGPQFLSDHPNPGNRVQAVENEIKDWPQRNFMTNSPQFASAKPEAAKVKAYTAQEVADGAKQGIWAKQNKQSGATPGNLPAHTSPQGSAGGGTADISSVNFDQVKPSGKFKQFQGDGLSIDYPDNWQAGGTLSSGGITIAPPAGVAQNAIAYGVSINAANDPNASSIDQATQDLIQSLQQSNQGLHASGQARKIKVNGVEGRSVNLVGISPVQQNGQPLPEHDWLVTLPGPQGGFVYVVFVAPENTFGRLQSTYKHMLNSLHLQ
ncbi:MAG TPA: M48 family metallopeptidase [Terriglobales bacterium]|nr:M48 family metallopeptidase [Terriglobales bacterium]